MSTRIILSVFIAVLAIGGGILYFGYTLNEQAQSEDANRLLDTGIQYFHQNNFQQSLDTLERIPAETLKDWRLPYYKASALVQLKDYEPAAGYLEQALLLNNSDTRILFALGVVYFKLGNLPLAEGYFASTLEIDPGNEHAKGLMDIMSKLQREQPAAGDNDTETTQTDKSE